MNKTQMWEVDRPLSDYEIEVPAWVDPDIHVSTIAAIVHGGCASGAYMPAVTYHEALKTMHEHGNEVLSYLENYTDDLTPPKGESWAGIAVFYLATAVEAWAHNVQCELEDLLPIPHSELRDLVASLIYDIGPDYRVDGVEGPAMDLTVATDDDASTFTYQTGDNSFTGPAYHFPHWAVTTLTPDSDPDEVAQDILDQWAELID